MKIKNKRNSVSDPCCVDLRDLWRTRFTFTMSPLESTIQILLAASSLLSPSLAMAMISR